MHEEATAPAQVPAGRSDAWWRSSTEFPFPSPSPLERGINTMLTELDIEIWEREAAKMVKLLEALPRDGYDSS